MVDAYRNLPALLLASAVAIGAAGASRAADMPPLPPVPQIDAPMPAPTPAEFSGWYLRGDVGYSFDQMSEFYSSASTYVPGFSYQASAIDGSIMLGAGVGYQFNNWFRTDVTADYRAMNYSALESYSNIYGNGSDASHAQIHSSVILANAYIDTGTWYGITPFIGGGVGFAFNQFNGLTEYGIGPSNYGGYGTAANANQINFAWDATVGISYSFAQNWKFEFSYRYLDMGKVTSNGIACIDPCGIEVQSFHLASSDVRLGLRYSFAEAPAPAPALPVITKY